MTLEYFQTFLVLKPYSIAIFSAYSGFNSEYMMDKLPKVQTSKATQIGIPS